MLCFSVYRCSQGVILAVLLFYARHLLAVLLGELLPCHGAAREARQRRQENPRWLCKVQEDCKREDNPCKRGSWLQLSLGRQLVALWAFDMGVMGKEHHPWDRRTMGSRRAHLGGWDCRKHCCMAKQVRHHITPLGFWLLPGRRTSPSPSKPHAVHAPPNTSLHSSGPNTNLHSTVHLHSHWPLEVGALAGGREH